MLMFLFPFPLLFSYICNMKGDFIVLFHIISFAYFVYFIRLDFIGPYIFTFWWLFFTLFSEYQIQRCSCPDCACEMCDSCSGYGEWCPSLSWDACHFSAPECSTINCLCCEVTIKGKGGPGEGWCEMPITTLLGMIWLLYYTFVGCCYCISSNLFP